MSRRARVHARGRHAVAQECVPAIPKAEVKHLLATIALIFPLAAPAADARYLMDQLPILTMKGTLISVPAFRIYVASGYAPSPRNIELLKASPVARGSLRLITFDPVKNNKNLLLCRGSFPVYGPNKTPFASLVEAGLNLELAESGLASPDAPRVQATLDEFDFSSLGTGKWTVAASFAIEGKPPLVISNEFTYPVSAGAVNACGDVMKALAGGVESFLQKLYADPRFAELAL